MSREEHNEQLALIEQVIKESIVIEWPKTMGGLFDSSEEQMNEIDCSPIIHRARNVVKCRSSHPTMRVKVCAISQSTELPRTVEAFFRATLVKLSAEPHESTVGGRHVAGRIILTQREGAASRSTDHCDAVVDSEGRVLASYGASEFRSNLPFARCIDASVKPKPFKFENGVLCSTFPEMGVALNSMIDRRQLATRYAIQVEVLINIDNKIIIQHIVNSLPFLIAITNDQTEPLLYSIFWQRLLSKDMLEPSEPAAELPPLKWKFVREALMNFPKAHCTSARALFLPELLHLQCMLLLPRFTKCISESEMEAVERECFGNVKTTVEAPTRLEAIRDRLLQEEIDQELLIHSSELLTAAAVSILDMKTPLKHSVWLWMFKAAEILMDVGHKLCPPPLLERKGSKTKRQLAASDEYLTMAALFNKGVITFCSAKEACGLLEYNSLPGSSKAEEKKMIARFDDENAGSLSFAFSNSSSKPIFGSITMDQIKDFKQGLPEVLIDEQFPSKYDRLLQLEYRENHFLGVPTKKSSIFHYYRSQRQPAQGISVRDEVTVRVNPLTGELLPRTNFSSLEEALCESPGQI
ncbi:unnamed protein product, partial [Mesorhabditis spiculigera]